MKKESTKDRWYVEINSDFQKSGQIEIIGKPVRMIECSYTDLEYVCSTKIFDVLSKLSGKKALVLRYLIAHAEDPEFMNVTNTELAERLQIGRNTVIDAMKILTEERIIVREGTLLRFLPCAASLDDQGCELAPAENDAQIKGQYEIIDTDLNIKEIC